MRIALLHTRYARWGGVEKYIAGLADRLLGAGHEVHYFSRAPSVASPPPRGLVLHPVAAPRWPEALKPLAFAYGARWSLRRAARRRPFDAVHGFSSTLEQDVYTDGSGPAVEFAALRGALGRGPLGRAWGRLAPRRWAARFLEVRRMRSPDLRRVLAMSELVRQGLLRRHAFPPERIEVLPPPVDLEEFHPREHERRGGEARRRSATPAGARVALFAGSGFARKGLDLLIDALASAAPPWVLWVLGRDRHRPSFEARAREAGVEARFLGATPEAPLFFAGADILVLPSRYDAFGSVVLEGMAAGLPVVVSARAGASEVVEEEVSGFVLRDPWSPRDLALRLEALAEPSLRERLGRGARSAAEGHSWPAHLERVLGAYRSRGDAEC